MMHGRAEPLPSPTPARSRRSTPPGGPARSQPLTGRPLLVRVLGLAIAALLTANGVIVAEQATNRDLISLGHDGVSNAREAIARLLEDNKDKGQDAQQVLGAVLEQSTTTTTAPTEPTPTTAAAAPAPVESTTSSAPPAVTTPTTAKKPTSGGAVDWGHVTETVRPY